MFRKYAATLLLVAALHSPAIAETFTVNNSNNSGTGSLAWAVNTINALDTSGHVISFDPAIKSVILTQELTLNREVTINGGGATLEGSGHGRLFTITNGHVQFNALTFTKGYAVSDNGGAVKVEGSSASAAFTNCTFFDNHADNFGGAVCVTNGSMTPRTTLTHCTLAGNLASNGGGFALLNGRAEMQASIIVGNTVSYDVYDATGGLIGDYNIVGAANVEMGATNSTGHTVSEVLYAGTSGLALEEVNGVNVLRLSGTSPARDIMTPSYGVTTDETGAVRPMLAGYDAGAFEARPVPVEGVEISGLPYVQVNDSETLTVSVTPTDASLNTRDYPPDGIVWQSSNPSAISVDQSGKVSAVGVGSAYITAAVYGWDSAGQAANPVRSNALTLYAGTEPRRPMKANVHAIATVSMGTGTYRYVKPAVSIDLNGYDIKGATYTLSVSSSRLDIVTADVVSGDTVRLLAGSVEGSCDVAVRATPTPNGESGEGTFTVSVSGTGSTDTNSNAGTNDGTPGQSSSGGGCNAGLAGTFALITLCIRRKNNA